MSHRHRIFLSVFLAASIAAPVQSLLAKTAPKVDNTRVAPASTSGARTDSTVTPADTATQDQLELLEDSRDAGLLTDWHFDGRYGQGSARDFAHRFSPERVAAKSFRKPSPHYDVRRYDLEFPNGTFALTPQMAGLSGIFYADSSTYLGDGDWNVYLESGAEAVVFFDGRRVLERSPQADGVVRATVHVASGYHSVLVKFVAAAAPFRVAILPPNSGSRRKNSTPYLKASPTSEDMMSSLRPDGLPPAGN